MLHAVGGQRGAGQAVHPVFISLTCPAFHYADRRLPVIVKQLFTDPLLAPAGILNLTTQTRGFPLLVVSNAFHRVTVIIQRNKGVHH
ncbi:hypothetical protein D3C80_859500 [compost metagenome]